MILEKFRKKLPPYWYENEVAEYHFEGSMEAIKSLDAQRMDLMKQFNPMTATWGLDIWDWIYFGKKQSLSIEERRNKIRAQHWARLPFTMSVLQSLGNATGGLLSVTEDFKAKEIVFSFEQDQPVDLLTLHTVFEKMRPVHVNRERITIQQKGSLMYWSGTTQVYESFPLFCGSFYAGGETSLC
ncbi:putative phage tail protein [Brevibacillus laterosporus]|uniref:DUF2313 domain-containing protein n=1 Tax=Brevibacillus laterosporus TaxID=1465 RepID=A0A0F7BYU1_BRELA|nr:hypothetical protein EX87_02270 [Brevibacillus laterosporus]